MTCHEKSVRRHRVNRRLINHRSCVPIAAFSSQTGPTLAPYEGFQMRAQEDNMSAETIPHKYASRVKLCPMFVVLDAFVRACVKLANASRSPTATPSKKGRRKLSLLP